MFLTFWKLFCNGLGCPTEMPMEPIRCNCPFHGSSPRMSFLGPVVSLQRPYNLTNPDSFFWSFLSHSVFLVLLLSLTTLGSGSDLCMVEEFFPINGSTDWEPSLDIWPFGDLSWMMGISSKVRHSGDSGLLTFVLLSTHELKWVLYAPWEGE